MTPAKIEDPPLPPSREGLTTWQILTLFGVAITFSIGISELRLRTHGAVKIHEGASPKEYVEKIGSTLEAFKEDMNRQMTKMIAETSATKESIKSMRKNMDNMQDTINFWMRHNLQSNNGKTRETTN